ncbi:MAG: hypothetical protein V1844_09850 [Pseudomonadota bacterium]
MGISGTYCKTFSEANRASCVGMNLNGRYPHAFFDVVKVEAMKVILRSHGDGSEFEFKIHHGRKPKTEYAEIRQRSGWVPSFGRDEKFRVLPMKGERF